MVTMSIWKYFKRVPTQPVKREDEGPPEPTSLLSKSVPVKAIELANAQVMKVQLEGKTCSDSRGESCQGGPYLILTPAQRYEVGKRAAEHSITYSIHYFAKKYPKLPLKEASVRRV